MIRKLYVVLGVALALFLVGGVASADDGITLAPTTSLGLLLTTLIAIVIPFLVDLVTKRFASSAIKSVTLIALSVVNGLLSEFLAAVNQNVSFNWETALQTAGFSFVVTVAAFFGFLKPTGVAGADGPLATRGGIGTVDAMKVVKAQEYGKLPPNADAADQGADGT